MNYLLIGGAGFIGTNLCLYLNNKGEHVTMVDKKKEYFHSDVLKCSAIVEDPLTSDSNFISLTKNQDIVFHMVSFSKSVSESTDKDKELKESIEFTSNLLRACETNHVKKVIFISSGGTVYGKCSNLPIKESEIPNPISTYGLEKVKDEECFADYKGDYHIFRLSNPYGKYQRVSGAVGAVTIFLYKVLHNEEITIVGDGSIVRDFIYIDDAIEAMINVIESSSKQKIYNIGTGIGTSINELLETIQNCTGKKAKIVYKEGRKVDVPANYLDVSSYEMHFGTLGKAPLQEGIKKIIKFYK